MSGSGGGGGQGHGINWGSVIVGGFIGVWLHEMKHQRTARRRQRLANRRPAFDRVPNASQAIGAALVGQIAGGIMAVIFLIYMYNTLVAIQ